MLGSKQMGLPGQRKMRIGNCSQVSLKEGVVMLTNDALGSIRTTRSGGENILRKQPTLHPSKSRATEQFVAKREGH